jgi:hypothetical protein
MPKGSTIMGEPPLGFDDLIQFARRDFGAFVMLLLPELRDQKQLVPAPYLDVMFEALMLVREGGKDRVIFNLPPGFMKSWIVSVLFVAWMLGVEPSQRILCISYGDELALQLSRLTRRIMISRRYRLVFPRTCFAKAAEHLLSTTKGGQRLAIAVGGPAAGFRADLVIIDDPMQPNEVASEARKQALRDWYASVVEQRLTPGAAIVVVMHRIASDDFTATLLASGEWFRLSFPLIAIETNNYFDRFGNHLWMRKPGNLLSPRWMTQEKVDEIRRRLPKAIFESQYQQNPQFGGTGICSIDRLSRYQNRSHYELIIHVWDLAATRNGGDFTVCAKFGLTRDALGREVFDLFGILRLQVELPDVRALIREQDRLDRPALIAIDGVGIGRGIVQELGREMSHITPGPRSMLKTPRMRRCGVSTTRCPPCMTGWCGCPRSCRGSKPSSMSSPPSPPAAMTTKSTPCASSPPIAST